MIVTELMTGGSLADIFRGPERLSTRRSCELALDCARGMVRMLGGLCYCSARFEGVTLVFLSGWMVDVDDR